MLLIIGAIVLVFTCVILVVLSISQPKSDQSVLTMRMQSIMSVATQTGEQMPHLIDVELGVGLGDRIFRPALRRFGAVALRHTPGGATQTMRATLTRAGNPYGFDVIEFTGAKIVSAVVFFFIGIVAQTMINDTALNKLLVFALFVVAGILLPDVLISRIIEARQNAIRRALPDTIDLLVVSVEAGMGFDGAIQRVTEKVKGPLADEFERVLHEMRLGKTRGKSLKDMGLRLGVQEISTFVAAVYQSEQLGVSIANVLRVQSRAIREARTQRIREAAAKLPIKMLFPLVFLIFPAIFMVLLGPGLISFASAFK